MNIEEECLSQEMDEEIRGFLSERAEKLHPGEPEIQEPEERAFLLLPVSQTEQEALSSGV